MTTDERYAKEADELLAALDAPFDPPYLVVFEWLKARDERMTWPVGDLRVARDEDNQRLRWEGGFAGDKDAAHFDVGEPVVIYPDSLPVGYAIHFTEPSPELIETIRFQAMEYECEKTRKL